MATLGPSGFALSRSCAFSDFAGCVTVADWQQALADRAWAEWQTTREAPPGGTSLVVNYANDVPFLAPNAAAIYQYPGEVEVTPPPALVAIYGLCVLDRIEAPVRFLVRARQRLRPGGLLLLTFAHWDAEGPDVALGSGSRLRIYDLRRWQKLVAEARRIGFEPFGGVDWSYHGDTLYDHTLASLVLTSADERRGGRR